MREKEGDKLLVSNYELGFYLFIIKENKLIYQDNY
jgi:hypothetical protein